MTCRYIPIDYVEAGQPTVLDRAMNIIVPRKQVSCRGDCARCDRLEPYVRPNGQPSLIKYVEVPEDVLMPLEVLVKAEQLSRERHRIPELKLTVGDQSVVTAQKRRPEIAMQYLRNQKQGLSIGDMSKVTDERESIEARVDADLARKDEALTVGDLFRGMRPNDFEPATSASQEVLMEMQRKQREKREEILHIQNLLAGGRDYRLEAYVDKYLKNKA
jgi:hypothetical protein